MKKFKETVNHNGNTVIDIREDVVAIVDGDKVQLNQLDALANSPFTYDSVYLDKETIIALAEQLKGER